MAQAEVPYAAVPRGSTDGRVHFSDELHESDADIEDNGLFEHRETMEVADNDTLYYGMSLGTRRRMRKGRVFWATVVCLVVVSVVGIFWLYFDGINWMQRSKKRNVILMVSDGFGPASETMARNFVQQVQGLPVGYQSPLDEILVGSSRTRSSDSLVTDSAAGATAFSCRMKSYNGAIGVDPERAPCGTVLEAAKLQRNMATGLVVTSRITHATPGAFSAHTTHRDMEDLIAEYQIGNYSLGPMVDLMFGGGRCHFEPGPHVNSCRTDARDLLSEARTRGFRTLESRSDFDALDAHSAQSLPLLGTFAPSHMDYEIDRDPAQQPSLAEMTNKALGILSAATKNTNAGFFLMIEGSRIDMAAHTNDPAAHVREIIAYWDAISAVRAYVDAHPDTVLISVSDHETGGFSVAKQLGTEYPEYLWDPFALEPVKHSIEFISSKLLGQAADSAKQYEFVRDTVFPKWMGIKDATHAEILAVAQETDSVQLRQLLSTAISDRAQLGWATHGHSAVDVNLYAYGKDAHLLRGNHENTDIGDFIVQALGLNLEQVTSLIKNDKVVQDTPAVKQTWMGRRDLDAPEHHPHMH
ncbi:vacuolar alkaline phosphatase [Coemansia sp. RSA 1822]|nr:vacuolar alkaline phosphatase [Coemansia sp. RSA 720]KAJ2542981.1 vacuolar alkaline phosphatase [Coemansia sp. RSA 1853]KAJ2563600.1 vacuolar alkaline phosphatase [Coemansia sp. RSA 1822]